MSEELENPYATPEASLDPDINVSQDDNPFPFIEDIVWPVSVRFKVLALAQQTFVEDSNGMPVFYLRRKILKLKEKVDVYRNKEKQALLAQITANKIIDWSAQYSFTLADESLLGRVGRKGRKSIWKASYETFNPGDDIPDYSITEENPMAKIFDAILGQIPILGFATSYLFHAKYLAIDRSGNPIMRLTKKPALWEGKFELELLDDSITPRQRANLVLSFMMMVMLERSRG